MKTNFYILLVLLLTVSLGNAQSNNEVANVETVKTISVSNDDSIDVKVNAEINTTIENDSLLIDAAQLKESIARSSSDIRIYLNRKRKAGNISLVFPKINKAVRV